MANNTPSSSGIGAPGTAPAPANLSRSPMAQTPSAPQGIPFTRGSSLATMRDATINALAAGQTTQVQLQTNAFLESLILDVSSVGTSGAATFNGDGPFNVIAQIKLDDPAGQAIVSPITGFQLFLLNKYLTDTDCNFDPARDPNYSASTSSGAFSFRLVVPVEHRRRDAFGALNNSAANQRYLLTITSTSSYGAGTNQLVNVYSSAPATTPLTGINIQVYQQYWTSPPSQITTSQGTTAVQMTPAGLGSVCFVRYERRNEVAGGGSPQFQLVSVGDYLSSIIWTLRTSTSTNVRDTSQGNWPSEFDFWVNDFQLLALSANDWQRWIARFYGYYSGVTTSPTAGALDSGVWPQFQMGAIFDASDNFTPANQYLPTDATTKLQVRGSSWGSSSQYVDVLVRMIRPVSGAALFA